MTELTIKKIASIVRKVCEKFAMSKKAVGFDFHNDPDLGCMCAVASATLYKVLKKNGYKKIKLYESSFDGVIHCWVEDENKNIIDITATQFRADMGYVIQPVEIVDKDHHLYKYYYHTNKVRIQSLNSHILQSWPKEQRANESLVDLLVNNSIKRIKENA